MKEFKELWKEIRKTVARREGQIKAKERNLNKDYNYDKTGNCTIENVEFYLKQNNIQLKYNVILHKMEIKGFNGENQDQIVCSVIGEWSGEVKGVPIFGHQGLSGVKYQLGAVGG